MIASKLIFRNIVLVSCIYSGLVFGQSNDAFLNPPEVIVLSKKADKHAAQKRKFTGIPSIAIAANGRMWATWYAGITPKEDENNYVVLSTSADDGDTWKEILIIDPDQQDSVRAYDPEVWVDPTGKLWFFWAQTIGHEGTVAGVWSINTIDPGTENPDWSQPKRLTDGIMMCKPTVLSTGEWILPASTWRKTDNSAKLIVSEDQGKSWKERGSANVPEPDRAYDEHMIVEKSDGTLWMLVRTKYGIGESFSDDRGKTWGTLVPSNLKHPSARSFIRRLQSGNLLLVKHGPIDMQTQRSHLMAFISQDDGANWTNGLLLDERSGVSYPDGQQLENGDIVIIYDYSRTKEQHILMTTFTENDILAHDYDESIIKVFNHRKTVSDGGID
ncbi:MAG: exo-alpha-sialidase [Saprospiraceae bacterium]|nr:exo-alpha-sialidase [Saprospiraceae bacterium]